MKLMFLNLLGRIELNMRGNASVGASDRQNDNKVGAATIEAVIGKNHTGALTTLLVAYNRVKARVPYFPRLQR